MLDRSVQTDALQVVKHGVLLGNSHAKPTMRLARALLLLLGVVVANGRPRRHPRHLSRLTGGADGVLPLNVVSP